MSAVKTVDTGHAGSHLVASCPYRWGSLMDSVGRGCWDANRSFSAWAGQMILAGWGMALTTPSFALSNWGEPRGTMKDECVRGCSGSCGRGLWGGWEPFFENTWRWIELISIHPQRSRSTNRGR